MPLLFLNVCLFVYLYTGEDTLRNKRDKDLQCEEVVTFGYPTPEEV